MWESSAPRVQESGANAAGDETHQKGAQKWGVMSTGDPRDVNAPAPRRPRIRCYQHIHLVSDSTGETLMSVMNATLPRFTHVSVREHLYTLVRSEKKMALTLKGIANEPGLVLFTLVDDERRRVLEAHCADIGVPAISILDSLVNSLTTIFGQPTRAQAGAQHGLDQAYYMRMEALDFAIAHDDGQQPEGLNQADVVLVGVSRTSKTPTCIYLAHRGVRAGNVPLVNFDVMPAVLDRLTAPLVVGLTASPERLVQIRQNRLNTLDEGRDGDYADRAVVRREVTEATRYFERRGWPVIDVTRRSVEETAARILNFLAERRRSLEP